MTSPALARSLLAARFEAEARAILWQTAADDARPDLYRELVSSTERLAAARDRFAASRWS